MTTYSITTRTGAIATRTSDHDYPFAAERADGHVSFHGTVGAARKAAGVTGKVHETTVISGTATKGSYRSIECSRCGTHYTTLRCPGCGF